MHAVQYQLENVNLDNCPSLENLLKQTTLSLICIGQANYPNSSTTRLKL